MLPRLRQVALVANDLEAVAGRLHRELGLPTPHHDPGVGEFGLTNSVFALGYDFLEVVAPERPDTTAGRYLDRMGGDGGYMAIFQVDDIAAARARVADLGVQVVWQHDLKHIGGTHLHPRDVPGAIVSIDWADPVNSWHWAGPDWSGHVPDSAVRSAGLSGIEVAVPDPAAAAARWAAVLGTKPTVSTDGASSVDLASGQQIAFSVSADAARITAVTIDLPTEVRAGRDNVTIGGVQFHLRTNSVS